MDEQFITAWNRVVKFGDQVIHLGDFALASDERIREIYQRLNGYTTLVLGNHDRSATRMSRLGFSCCKMGFFGEDGKKFFLRHDPRKFTKEEAEEGDLLLHGHLHGQLHYEGIAPSICNKLFDVGVDATKRIAPVPIAEIVELFKKRPWLTQAPSL
jgi:calcineurin-like phosphoesterase family protein